jgi:hypothetical protein
MIRPSGCANAYRRAGRAPGRDRDPPWSKILHTQEAENYISAFLEPQQPTPLLMQAAGHPYRSLPETEPKMRDAIG